MPLILRPILCSLLAVLLLAGCQNTPQRGLSEAQVAVLKAQGFVWTEEGWEFDLSGKLLFATDSEQLSDESRVVISRITTALLGVGIADVTLEGHTDNQGSAAYNQQLSLRRASTVAEAMIASGMQENAIELRGMGKMRPITGNDTAEGRRENRRVSIIVGAE